MNRFAFVTIFLCCLALYAGCGKPTVTSDAGQARAVLKVLGQEYGRYMVEHNGQPPADEAALREFLGKQMSRLQTYGVKSVDQLLQSPRDGQPLVLVLGKKVEVADAPDAYWAAYEATGFDGNHLAGNTRGGVAELADAELPATTAKD